MVLRNGEGSGDFTYALTIQSVLDTVQTQVIKQALFEILDYEGNDECSKDDFVELLIEVLSEGQQVLLVSGTQLEDEDLLVDDISLDARVSNIKKIYMLCHELIRENILFTLEKIEDL